MAYKLKWLMPIGHKQKLHIFLPLILIIYILFLGANVEQAGSQTSHVTVSPTTVDPGSFVIVTIHPGSLQGQAVFVFISSNGLAGPQNNTALFRGEAQVLPNDVTTSTNVLVPVIPVLQSGTYWIKVWDGSTWRVGHPSIMVRLVGGGVTFIQSGSSIDTNNLLKVDGIQYSSDQLPIQFRWDVGSVHSYEWQPFIQSSENERDVFVPRKASQGSIPGGERTGSLTVLDGQMVIEAVYKAQIRVTFDKPVASDPNETHTVPEVWAKSYSGGTISHNRPVWTDAGSSWNYVVQSNISTSERWTIIGSSGAGSTIRAGEVIKPRVIHEWTLSPIGPSLINEDAVWYKEGDSASIMHRTVWNQVPERSRTVLESYQIDDRPKIKVSPSAAESYSVDIVIDRAVSVRFFGLTQYFLEIVGEEGSTTGQGWYDEGTSVTFSADPRIILKEQDTSLLFVSWTGERSFDESSMTFVVNSPVTLQANWKTQYFLDVSSPISEASGTGWYDEGETATFSLQEASTGFLVRRAFSGWGGDSVSKEVTSTIVMDSSKVISANWEDDYTQLLAVIGAVVVVVVVSLGMVTIMKRRKKTV